MKKLTLFALTFIVACTTPYSPTDRPSIEQQGENREIIDYIDKRLTEEYYWLDEYVEKSGSFDRNMNWEQYLDRALLSLRSNADDGYINPRGERVLYSYIREISNSTLATQSNGYGIVLYYTVVGVSSEDSNRLGFIVDYVYPETPAAEAGIERGDLILNVNSTDINRENYLTLFNTIQNSSTTELSLNLYRPVLAGSNEALLSCTMQRTSISKNPIVHSEVIIPEGSSQRIGYLVYTGFDSEFNTALVDTMSEFEAAGITHLIIDLRCNGGGSVSSAITLVSATLDRSYHDAVLCELRRNPRNTAVHNTSYCTLTEVGASLGLSEVTIICSENSASASELVIEGLRGLDIPVHLIGSTTEGKNCGMDVTRRTVGGRYLEYAPITFMCYNAKGFGDYGEGITPDWDLTVENGSGLTDKNYPLPRCQWGNKEADIALTAAISAITGAPVANPTTRTATSIDLRIEEHLPRQFVGIRNE